MRTFLKRTSAAALLAITVATATALPATATEQPPPVPPQLPEPALDWEDYFTGCTDWDHSQSGRWVFSCAWGGETWISQAFYYWDADAESSLLYRTTYLDWVDMWGWDCYIPGQCNA